MLKEYEGYAERIRPYVCDTIALLNDEVAAGRKILFEGAQATMAAVKSFVFSSSAKAT